MPHDRLRFARGRRPHAGRRSRRYMRQEQPPSKRGPASAPGPRYSLDTESRSGERQKQVIAKAFRYLDSFSSRATAARTAPGCSS